MLRTNTHFERQFASHSLLFPWQTSPYPLYKGVLCYPPPLKGGIIRASPGLILTRKCQGWKQTHPFFSNSFKSHYHAKRVI